MRGAQLTGLIPALILGCAAGAVGGQQDPVAPATPENGSTIELRSGHSLDIGLPAQLGTGYSWVMVKSNSTVLRLTGSRIESRKSVPGGMEAQIFTFSPVRPGSADVEFVYRQPWAPDAEPSKRLQFRVVVVR